MEKWAVRIYLYSSRVNDYYGEHDDDVDAKAKPKIKCNRNE